VYVIDDVHRVELDKSGSVVHCKQNGKVVLQVKRDGLMGFVLDDEKFIKAAVILFEGFINKQVYTPADIVRIDEERGWGIFDNFVQRNEPKLVRMMKEGLARLLLNACVWLLDDGKAVKAYSHSRGQFYVANTKVIESLQEDELGVFVNIMADVMSYTRGAIVRIKEARTLVEAANGRGIELDLSRPYKYAREAHEQISALVESLEDLMKLTKKKLKNE
jgi:hypothetical protein